MLQRFLVCLSFATLCFLNTWVEFAEGEAAHVARFDPVDTVFIPVMCWEVILTLLLLAIWEFCRRRPLPNASAVHLSFLVTCLAPLGIVCIATLRMLPFNLIPLVQKQSLWVPAFLLACVPIFLVFRRPRASSRIARKILLYCWPILIIVLIQGMRRTLLRYPHSAYADGPLAKVFPSPPPRVRLVWIIFDELSQAIAFGHRPASLSLSNLDGLRAESFYASSARPPADYTEESMPSLILGERVDQVVWRAPNELLVQIRGGSSPITWSSVDNVFDAARRLAYNTAIVGSFIPYCRLLNNSLTECYWTAGWLLSGAEERIELQSLGDAMWERARLQFALFPVIRNIADVYPGKYHREAKARRYSFLLDRALEVVSDPSIGLALIHFPIPHPPAIYNRSTGQMTSRPPIGYLDSVALVDNALGRLRYRMEQAGQWDRTAVLVSADHGWRTFIWRGGPEMTADDEAASHTDTSGVPFLLKLPGQTSTVAYGSPFNTVTTRQVITAILQGRLTDPVQIPDLIEHIKAN